MQKLIIALLVAVALVVGFAVFKWLAHADIDTAPTPTTLGAPTPAPPTSPYPSDITTLSIAETAASLNSTDSTIEEDFSTLLLLLSQYRKHLGMGNPVGDNDEITAALLGRNPKGLAYLPATGSFMDTQGRLIDRWGTPYFFHAISAEHMRIHSAGPDRKLHTSDDIVSEF